MKGEQKEGQAGTSFSRRERGRGCCDLPARVTTRSETSHTTLATSYATLLDVPQLKLQLVLERAVGAVR